ncbi:MAG: agmatine deiminase family protein [Ignavibacteriaceae bacterium]|nr:agmatine deiminase family protein [Ignavibacteriaceae bacterium]
MNIRYPAEFEKHKATILVFPFNVLDWPGKFGAIPWVYTEIIRHLCKNELIYLIYKDKFELISIKKKLNLAGLLDHKNIILVNYKTSRSWVRDTSPSFIFVDKQIKAVKFKFNGWAKYSNCRLDSKLPEALCAEIGVELSEAKYKGENVVLEGGAIDINGAGTLITTEECLMDQETQVRNPGFTKEDYSKIFFTELGIKNVIWLGKGIAGDDTHGHVDDLCRFVNKNTLVLVREKNPKDENYKNLEENVERLQDAKLQNGSKPEVVYLPMPEPVVFDDMRLPASYANFYIANGKVLVPTFNDKNDYIALGILKELFPGREVCGIHAVDLVWGLGTLHCLAHEIPDF